MPVLSLIVAATSLLPIQFHGRSDGMREQMALTKGARAEMRSALKEFDSGFTARAARDLRGILVESGASVGFEDAAQSRLPLAQALRVWKAAVPDSPFRIAGPDERPDVTIRIVSTIQDSDEAQGQVSYMAPSDEEDGRLHATLLIRSNVEGREIHSDEEQAVLTHEIGHLLGLEDSENDGGIMGSFDPNAVITTPLPIEASAVNALRKELREHLANVLDTALGF